MELNELRPAENSSRGTKRVGRGMGSGHGKTSCRGQKGQWSRSGGGVRPGFEGGQTTLSRRLPKRGFHNIFSTKYAEVNLVSLNAFRSGSNVTNESLLEKGIISEIYDGVKILGKGELTKKLNIKVKAFSASAKAKIEAAGGKAEEV